MPADLPDEFVVPAVDISPYATDGSPQDRARVAREIDSACANVGFIQVLGHGIPDATIRGLVAAMDAFFALPGEAKKDYRVADANRGYSPPRSMTNDRWMSTLHRVKPPVVEGTIKRRRSAAFFHDGNADAVIETIASHRDYDPGLAYEPITVRDHIKAKLQGSRQGKRNTAAVREAHRVLAAIKASATEEPATCGPRVP